MALAQTGRTRPGDRDWRPTSSAPATPPGRPSSTPTNPPTSSTPRDRPASPKGCVVSHRNVTRLMASTEPLFGFGPDDVWTLFHSFAFDFSVWEIWGPLLYGGRSGHRSVFGVARARRFRSAARRRKGDGAQPDAVGLPPVDPRRRRGRPSARALRWVVFGGEALELAKSAPVVRASRRSRADAGQHVRHHRDHGACDVASAELGRCRSRGAARRSARRWTI